MNTNADPEHAPTVPIARYIAAIGAAEMLWTVVANTSNGDWTKQSAEWQEAAARWRDAYIAELRHHRTLVPDSVRSAAGTVDAPPAPTPPADAQEPPWVVATRTLWTADDRRVAELDRRAVEHIIQTAAEQHAAALAQERDALRVEYESRAAWIAEMNRILGYDNSDGFHSEPDPHTLARQLVAEWAKGKDELETLRATVARLTEQIQDERNKLCKEYEALGESTDTEIERLTAERDRYHAALLGVANHVYITGQSCWCNAWEDNPEHYRAEQHHAYCTVALALSTAPSAVDKPMP